MRYINNTLITIIKKKHQHNIESTQLFHSSPLSSWGEKTCFCETGFNKLIKSTMLQLRMKGLKRTIYYLSFKGTTPPTLTRVILTDVNIFNSIAIYL
jgi:hypothetical protein